MMIIDYVLYEQISHLPQHITKLYEPVVAAAFRGLCLNGRHEVPFRLRLCLFFVRDSAMLMLAWHCARRSVRSA